MDPTQRPVILNADGTVNIHCRLCGEFISRMMYQGFTTATCTYCEREEARPLPDEDIELDPLSSSAKVGEHGMVFRVVGFLKKKAAEVASKASTKMSKKRAKKPLLERTDDESN